MRLPACMPSTRRIQDIERLRAIAALSVLIGHVPWLYVGLSRLIGVSLDPWTGVDLFFVISGFVVSSAFERDLVQPPGISAGAALATFYRKRAARILPTAYLGLALWWVGVTWFNASGAWGQPLHGNAAVATTVSGLLLVSNYATAFAGVTMPLFWFWSICIEEHFYLLYPTFRMAVPDAWRRVAAVACTIVAVHAVRGMVDDPQMLSGLSHMRFDQLGLGVLIGILHRQWGATGAELKTLLGRPGRFRVVAIATLLVLLGVLLLVLPITLLRDQGSADAVLGYALAGVLSAAIVVLASCDADLLIGGRARPGGVLVWLGARSYAIYMFHVPALWIVVETRQRLFADPRAAWLHAPEVMAYCVVLGMIVEANYRWVERPLVAWAARKPLSAQ